MYVFLYRSEQSMSDQTGFTRAKEEFQEWYSIALGTVQVQEQFQVWYNIALGTVQVQTQFLELYSIALGTVQVQEQFQEWYNIAHDTVQKQQFFLDLCRIDPYLNYILRCVLFNLICLLSIHHFLSFYPSIYYLH